jgi:predicted ATPase
VNTDLPLMIGINGFPTHGKSTAQRFLSLLGVEARDDARSLREGAMKEFGLTYEQVTTQEGKLQLVEAFGRTMTVRQVLGDYGQIFERRYGPNYWIAIEIERLRAERVKRPVSFGSLRRSQASVIKENGGFVIEVLDPRKPISKHAFDEYDRDYVDVQIINDGSLLDLATRTMLATAEYLNLDGAAAHHALASFELELEFNRAA